MVNHRRAIVTWILVAWATVAPVGAHPVTAAGQAIGTPSVATDRVLRLAGPTAGLEGLDPSLAPDQATTEILRLVFSGLVRFDADLTPVLDLAERIDVSPDAMRYEARLRPDARFHDGRPILAVDVASSLARALTPSATMPASALSGPLTLLDIAGASDLLTGNATTLAGVSTPDERTVVIDLDRPRTDFLPRLASVAGLVTGGPAPAGGTAGTIPNGSGPFRVVSWQPERELRLARVEKFVEGDRITGVSYLLGAGAERPFNLYQQGLIDVTPLPAGSAARVLDDPALAPRVIRQSSFATHHIAFRTDQAPLDDRDVRLAIQLAFPRAAVADVTFGGLAAPADGLLPDSLLALDAAARLPAPDLAAARAALARSRYGSAAAVPPFEIASHADQTVEAVRDVLRRDLGLRVTVVSYPWPEFLDGLAAGAFPAYGLLWVADFPSPDALLWTLFGSGSPANASGYRNPAFDAAIEAARREPDPTARQARYARAHAILVADAVFLPTYHPVEYLLAGERIRGVTVTPIGLLEVDHIEIVPAPVVVG